MLKIGIVGSTDYVFVSKIGEMIKKIKDSYGPTAEIYTGGGDGAIPNSVLEHCLDFGIAYKEYNPSYTGYNQYSQMHESYYGKSRHPTHFIDRYDKLLNKIDKLLFFIDKDGMLEDDLKYLLKKAVKSGLPFSIIY